MFPVSPDGLLINSREGGLPAEINSRLPGGWIGVNFAPLEVTPAHAIAFIERALPNVSSYRDDWLGHHPEIGDPPPAPEEYLTNVRSLARRLLPRDELPPVPRDDLPGYQMIELLNQLADLLHGEDAEKPHTDGPEGEQWVWLAGERYTIKSRQVHKFIKYMWDRSSMSLDDLEVNITNARITPESVRKLVYNKVNKELEKMGSSWTLSTDHRDRVIVKKFAGL